MTHIELSLPRTNPARDAAEARLDAAEHARSIRAIEHSIAAVDGAHGDRSMLPGGGELQARLRAILAQLRATAVPA